MKIVEFNSKAIRSTTLYDMRRIQRVFDSYS